MTYERGLANMTERPVDLTLCSTGEWRAPYEATFTGTIGDRLVSVQASEPVFTSDSAACPTARS